MAVNWVSAGAVATSTAGASSFDVAIPSSVASGNLLVLVVAQKPATANGGGVTTPAGWTLRGSTSGGGYGATLGADVGNTTIRVFTKVSTGGEAATQTVALSDNNVAMGYIQRFANSTSRWTFAYTSTTRDTAPSVGTPYTVTASTNGGLYVGDYLMVVHSLPTDDPAGFWTQSLSSTPGVTWNLVGENTEPYTDVGDDLGMYVAYSSVATGTATGPAAFTHTAGSAATNARGPFGFLRIREAPANAQVPGISGTHTGGVAGSSTFEVPVPAGSLGAVAFAHWYGSGSALTPPSGWTQYLVGNSNENSQSDPYTNFGIWIAGASAGTTWNHTDAGGGASVTVLGLDTGVQVNVAAGQNHNTEGGTAAVTCPAATTTAPTLVIRSVHSNLYGATPTWTYPGVAALARTQKVQLAAGEYWTTAIAAAQQASAGTTGSTTFSQNADQWYPRGQTLALTVVEAPPSGSGIGTLVYTGAAEGQTPGQAQSSGSATGSLAYTGTAQGAAANQGSATGALVFDGEALGPTTLVFGKHLSTNRRYLVDQNGAPWLMRMTSPWGWVAHYTLAEWTSYFTNIAGKGFNATLFEVIATADGGGGVNNDGRNYAGTLPFVGGDITNLNTSYWSHIAAIVDAANAVGITPILSVMDGWALDPVFTGKSQADCTSYGQQVATLMNGKHVLWHLGGDYEPVTNEPWDGATTDLRMRACLAGIRAAGHDEAFTLQLNYDYSFTQQNQFWEREVAGNSGDGWSFVYTYYATYAAVYEAYTWDSQANQWPGDRNPRPAIFSEANYQGENAGPGGAATTNETLRRQTGWALTFGSPGFGYGDANWDGTETSYTAYLNTPPPTQINNLADRVTNHTAWPFLEPDTSLITSGAGTRRIGEVVEDVLANDYATAARTPDGGLALVYVPSNSGNTARSITIDMSRLGSNPVATWYDPVTYATTSAGAGPTFTTPGVHSDGTRDYLLEITADTAVPEGSATGSSSWSGTASGARPVSGSAVGTVSVVGSAAGRKVPVGTAAGSAVWVGSASSGGTSAGLAQGAASWSGSAVGTVTKRGGATGGLTYAAVAAGLRAPFGSSSGMFMWVGIAEGGEMGRMLLGWSVDWAGTQPEGADPARVVLSEAYAVQALRALTLFQVGGPDITVMPSGGGCRHHVTSNIISPYLHGGVVYNGCGCAQGCSCPRGPSVLLTPPVGRIVRVVVDGQVLDASAYRVEDGHRLVRLDGGSWPQCPRDDFTVTYLNGHQVDPLGERAAGILALEFYKAMVGDRGCRIPASATAITRQGISLQVNRGLFPDGLTGITEVDVYIRMWNPYGLVTAPQVFSPDLRMPRRITWP